MTAKDLELVVRGVAPAMREYVALAITPWMARFKALEDRPLPRDGKDGADGKAGPVGAVGPEGIPGPPGPAGPASVGERGLTGEKGADGVGDRGPEGPPGPTGPARDGRDGLPGVPGIGEKGADGINGRDGIDGRDGTLKDQIKVARRSERVIEFCFKDDTPIEGGLIKLNHPVFKGTFVKGADRDEGDLVQWDGGSWIAVRDKPPGVPGHGSPDTTGWRLFTKAGAPGKDLRPEMPAPALPVVSVGSPKP